VSVVSKSESSSFLTAKVLNQETEAARPPMRAWQAQSPKLIRPKLSSTLVASRRRAPASPTYVASRRRAPNPEPAEGEFHTRKPSADGEPKANFSLCCGQTNKRQFHTPKPTLYVREYHGNRSLTIPFTWYPTSGGPKASSSLPNPKVFCHRSHPRVKKGVRAGFTDGTATTCLARFE
jgi:hypothetical protein